MREAMFPIERREKIIENLEKNGSITVEALAQKLEVTPTTIRRDLKYLEDNDRITRTFGGAVVKEGRKSASPGKPKNWWRTDRPLCWTLAPPIWSWLCCWPAVRSRSAW